MHTLRLAGFIVLSIASVGCFEGGSTPSASQDTSSPDPCAATAALENDDAALEAQSTSVTAAKRRPRLDGDSRWSVLNSLWLHSGQKVRQTASASRHGQDVGDVAVVQDAGDIMVSANAFDLASLNLRFVSNGAGYDVSRTETAFRSGIGSPLTLTDDDTNSVNLPFAFPFFARSQTVAFVNADGNITFGENDIASTDRSVSRFLTGPPRVAPFFADLDPSTGSGRVYLQTGSDGAVVTWCGVRGFDSTSTVTVQAVLLPDGTIEFHYGSGIGLRGAVVGVAPGASGQFQAIDLSATGTLAGGNAAVGERFSATTEIDLVALAKRFYETHADNFDQLVIFTNTSVVAGNTFAYESTIANEISGLGIDQFDAASDFGSAGRLRSLVVMDALTKYPDSPTETVLGANNTLSVLGQEAGHRWLAFLRFRDVNNATSSALLGRDQAHWSFFMDSDASVMEGNDIEDLGGGAFKTTDAVRRYSLLDQYAMGLVSASQVPNFFYVESPVNVQPSRQSDDDPEIGVTFNGTRRDVSIQDVIDVMGARSPSASNSSKVLRQAFIYAVSAGASVDSGQVSKMDAIRRAWVTFFNQATSGRMRADTSLD
jgi:hypothetical protein